MNRLPPRAGCYFGLDSHWHLNADIGELRAIVADPLSLARWWSAVFMRAEVMEPGGDGFEGMTVRFHTKGLLPHTFQFAARIVRAGEDELAIEIQGDFVGGAAIRTRSAPGGVHVHIAWRVLVRQPYIRPFLRIFHPIFAANHRWAMRRGHEGLEQEIIRRRRGSRDAVSAAAQTPAFPHNLFLVRRAFRWTRSPMRWSG